MTHSGPFLHQVWLNFAEILARGTFHKKKKVLEKIIQYYVFRIRYSGLSNSHNEVYYGIISRIHNAIFERIICERSNEKYSINHNFAKTRIVLYSSSPIKNWLFVMV